MRRRCSGAEPSRPGDGATFSDSRRIATERSSNLSPCTRADALARSASQGLLPSFRRLYRSTNSVRPHAPTDVSTVPDRASAGGFDDGARRCCAAGRILRENSRKTTIDRRTSTSTGAPSDTDARLPDPRSMREDEPVLVEGGIGYPGTPQRTVWNPAPFALSASGRRYATRRRCSQDQPQTSLPPQCSFVDQSVLRAAPQAH